MTTLSSWSYGKIFARFNHGWTLLLVMLGTTVASSLLSLGNLAIVAEAHDTSRHWTFYLVILLVGAITTFAGEWQFLPDVVLATTTVGTQDEEMVESVQRNIAGVISSVEVEGAASSMIKDEDCCRAARDDLTGIQYGTLISCIDFGDQIGSWITVPLVTALGISRENDWVGLDGMIILTAALGLSSVLFLGILRE